MKMRLITNVCLPHPLNQSPQNQLWCISLNDQGVICSFQLMDHQVKSDEDWKGDWLSPRAVDIQINGGLGISFSELSHKDIPKLYELLDKLWLDGVEAICPTIISSTVQSLRNSLEVLRLVRKEKYENKCMLLGAHLEGPFIAKLSSGAHQLQHICLPTLEALHERIAGFEEEIDLVTVAPELPHCFDVIKRLNELGIVISLGHSMANSEITKQAFNKGLSMLTHVFNAMPSIHHREIGPIGEAIGNGGIFMGLIADGVHVHPNIALMLQKVISEKLVLVTDALPPYGTNEINCKWDQRKIVRKDYSCRLEDGTLAGTTLPLLEGCKNIARWSADIPSAIWSATISPRNVFNKRAIVQDYLLGKPLNQLLRWSFCKDSHELYWQQAA